MEILPFISIFIFVDYVASVTIKYGWLPSISASFYSIPVRLRFLFTLFCWGFSLPLMIYGLNQTGNILMFLAPTGIAFVGAAAAFKGDKMTRNVHMVGAITGVVLSLLAVIFVYNQLILGLVAVGLITALIGLNKLKLDVNYFFWIEVITYAAMISSMLMK